MAKKKKRSKHTSKRKSRLPEVKNTNVSGKLHNLMTMHWLTIQSITGASPELDKFFTDQAARLGAQIRDFKE